MFRLTTKSLFSVSKNVLFKANRLKTTCSLYPYKVCFFSTSQVPINQSDQSDKEWDRKVKDFVYDGLKWSGGSNFGLLCVAGCSAHFNLNLTILGISGLIAGVGGLKHEENNSSRINWPAITSLSLLSAWGWKAFANISNFNDLEAATMVLTFFPSIALLTATVFGASALYVRYASQVSLYRPAMAGTLAGMGLIAAETCIPGNISVLGHLYTPEQLSDIYSYMVNTLPFLTSATFSLTLLAIKCMDMVKSISTSIDDVTKVIQQSTVICQEKLSPSYNAKGEETDIGRISEGNHTTVTK